MPKLVELTPVHLRCIPASCPAVYAAGDDLIIIGKQLDKDMLLEISGKVGHDEYAVRISKEFFPNLEGTGG